MPDFDPVPVSPAKLIALRAGLRVWKLGTGAEGVNVYSKDLADELHAAGCAVRVFQPELTSKPERLAWECIFPMEVTDDLGESAA